MKAKESIGHAERLAIEQRSAATAAGMTREAEGQRQAHRKGDGKGGKGGRTTAKLKACFGSGNTSHFVQDCPHRMTPKV